MAGQAAQLLWRTKGSTYERLHKKLEQFDKRAYQIIKGPFDVRRASRVSAGPPVIHFIHCRSDIID